MRHLADVRVASRQQDVSHRSSPAYRQRAATAGDTSGLRGRDRPPDDRAPWPRAPPRSAPAPLASPSPTKIAPAGQDVRRRWVQPHGRPDPGRGHRAGSGADLDRRRHLRARHAQVRRRRQPQGPVPLPRREDAVVHRRARPQRLLLPRLRARRRRHLVPDGRRPPVVRRVGRAAGRPGRHPAALHRGRPGPGPPAAGAEAAAGRRTRRGRRVLRRPARDARRAAGPRVPGQARLRPGRRRALRLRVRPRRVGPRSPSTCARRASPARSWSPRACPGRAGPGR